VPDASVQEKIEDQGRSESLFWIYNQRIRLVDYCPVCGGLQIYRLDAEIRCGAHPSHMYCFLFEHHPIKHGYWMVTDYKK